MPDKNIVPKRFLFLAVVSLAILVLLLWALLSFVREQDNVTEVVFLNVGEGDAILISQGAHQILIDGGRDGRDLLYRLGRHVPFWDRRIEAIIATHPDADHIGGLVTLMRTYRIGQVLTTGAESDTDIMKLFHEAADRSAPERQRLIFRGASLKLSLGGELVAEYPERPVSGKPENTNAESLVLRFTYGETSFLLTGDLPREESALPNEQPVTALKVSHHGSKYSTSDAFLDMVRPKEAVISVGKNSYGHPGAEVLERLARRNIDIHRTDEEGDIAYVCRDQRCLREE
jgi:competence protein ComEC